MVSLPTYVKGQIYIDPTIANSKGVVKLDFQEWTKQYANDSYTPAGKSIDDYKLLKDGTAPADESYYPVAATNETFKTLKVSKRQYDTDLTCDVAGDLYESGDLNFLGYAIKAVTGDDIIPSITFILKNGIKEIQFTNIPAETAQVEAALTI
ncbi:MAG: hypothetical protein EZS28_018704 [Streblomastix strix]|uniref:Uncharacterized protein n=1 Tax=Streblomastix strix TaxID=222440 RepID=A0A5J4VT55_9EUKA|nr:MAG: hypothetical protein EZS28_018704 [Streblomastix strix]